MSGAGSRVDTEGRRGIVPTQQGGTGVGVVSKGGVLYAVEPQRWKVLDAGAVASVLTMGSNGLPYWHDTPGGTHTLGSHVDTNFGTLHDDQTIYYDTGTSKWVHGRLPAEGGGTSFGAASITTACLLKGAPGGGDWVIHGHPADGGTYWLRATGTGEAALITWADPFSVLTLGDLSDVTISSPADKQYLKYVASSSKWENKALTLTDAAFGPDDTFICTRSSVVQWDTITAADVGPGVFAGGEKYTFPTSTASYASINLPHGTSPTTPVNGDVWTTSGSYAFCVRLGGATRLMATTDSAQTLTNKTMGSGCVWNGGIISTAYGGLGANLSAISQYDIIFGDDGGAFTNLSVPADGNSYLLRSSGVIGLIDWWSLGSLSINDLGDVYAPSPANHNYLRYIAANSRWEQATLTLTDGMAGGDDTILMTRSGAVTWTTLDAGDLPSHTHPASQITSPGALSRTNDTNVTLTLGGSPTVALLAATSITAGWAGQLALGRGGTGSTMAGLSSDKQDVILSVADGSSLTFKNHPGVAGKVLLTTSIAYEWATSGTIGGTISTDYVPVGTSANTIGNSDITKHSTYYWLHNKDWTITNDPGGASYIAESYQDLCSVTMRRAEGTEASKEVMISANFGVIYAYGWDGSAWSVGTGITLASNGTWSTSNRPGYLSFQTRYADGNLTTRWIIAPAGQLYPGANAAYAFGDPSFRISYIYANYYVYLYGSSGGWERAFYCKNSSGTTLGGFGFKGTDAAMDYFFIGPAWDNNYARFDDTEVTLYTGRLNVQSAAGNMVLQLEDTGAGAANQTDAYIGFYWSSGRTGWIGYAGNNHMYVNSETGYLYLRAYGYDTLKMNSRLDIRFPGVSGSAMEIKVGDGTAIGDSCMITFASGRAYCGYDGATYEGQFGTGAGSSKHTALYANGVRMLRLNYAADYIDVDKSLIMGTGKYIYMLGTPGNFQLEPDATYRILKITNPDGYVRIGAANTSHAHFLTDRASFYFQTEIKVAGGIIGSYSEDLSIRRAGAEKIKLTTVGFEVTGKATSDMYDNGTKTANFNIDANNGNAQRVTVNANSIQLTPTNFIDGDCVVVLIEWGASATSGFTVNASWGDAGAPSWHYGAAFADKIVLSKFGTLTSVECVGTGYPNPT